MEPFDKIQSNYDIMRFFEKVEKVVCPELMSMSSKLLHEKSHEQNQTDQNPQTFNHIHKVAMRFGFRIRNHF